MVPCNKLTQIAGETTAPVPCLRAALPWRTIERYGSGMQKLSKLANLLKNPVAIGAIAFVAAMIVIGMFMGPTTCNSGWASGSIGRRGACSHHGGVNHGPAQLRFFTSILFGVAAGMFANKIQNSRAKNSLSEELVPRRLRRRRIGFAEASRRWEVKALESSNSDGTICPTCKSTMRALVQNGRIQLKCVTEGCGYERRYR